MNLIKLKQLDQTELTTFVGTINDPLYINNPSGYLTFASGVMMTTGNQIISGNKTFSGILFGSGGWSISGGDFLINYEKNWDNIVNTAAVSKRDVDARFIRLTGNTSYPYPNLISGMTASIGMRGSNSYNFGSNIYPANITAFSTTSDDVNFTTTGLDTKNRRLLDGFQTNRGVAGSRPGGVHFNNQDKKLIDSIGLKSVDWDMRRLFVTNGVAYTGIDSTVYSLDYQTRKLHSTGNSIAVDWGGRTLYDSSSAPSVNWSDSKLYTSNGVYSTAGTPSVDWSNRILYDFDESNSVDWYNRRLIDNNDDITINWQDKELLNSVGSPTVMWNVTKLQDDSNMESVDWHDRLLRDESAVSSVDWNYRELKDTNNDTTVDWENKYLYEGWDAYDGITSSNLGSDWSAIGNSDLVTKEAVNDTTPFILPIVQYNNNTAVATGAGRTIAPFKTNPFSDGYGTIIPYEFTKFRVSLYIAYTSNPTSDLFPVYVRFNKPNTNSTSTQESLHGTRFGTTAYPDNNTGLLGTLTDLGAAGGKADSFKFVSNWETIPAGWQSNAASLGFYEILGVWLGNNSGGTLTDNYNANHAIRGMIEFKK
ncbi:hypothetical protein [Flavobacterium sp.]|uniref:hypothetical protein n=1 Tax=Flavobacterium sp. TaxID=239 RepID=UPI0038FD188C